ncbi:TPA: EAL domain-containing protein [Citrobacter freundii]
MKHKQYDEYHVLNSTSFEPYFQPIIDINNEKCIGVEVLARLVSPVHAFASVYPSLLESYVDQKEITRIMFDKVMLLLKDIPFPHGFKLSFNIPANLLSEDWLSIICDDFFRACNNNLKLVLEITEHTSLTINNDSIKSGLSRLNNKNIQIALDDFGTGYSNIMLVKMLPVDIIKIPRDFIDELPNSNIDNAIIDSIISLSLNSSIQLVAEGVESAKQSHYLVNKGINLQQGYYFSHPMNSSDLVIYLNKKFTLYNQIDNPMSYSEKHNFKFPHSLLVKCAIEFNLSVREKEVLAFISKGTSVNTISKIKHRSYKTIWTHKNNAYKKIGVKNDADFINYLHVLGAVL